MALQALEQLWRPPSGQATGSLTVLMSTGTIEAEVGEGLQKCFKEGVVKREEIFVTTKLWYIIMMCAFKLCCTFYKFIA